MDYQDEKRLETGEATKYRYYRLAPSDVVTEVPRTIQRKHGTKKQNVSVRQPKKEYYSEESIMRFELESHSKLLPDLNGNKTIVNNYLLRFWGPSFDSRIGGIVAYTYIILSSYCWDKDYTWIGLDTITKQLTCSKTSARKYLDILEKAGFIIRFWREQDDDTRMNGTILIKVRRSLPLLSREQYNALPKSLRKEHDRFLRKIKRESQVEYDLSHNYHEVYEQLRSEVISVKNPTGILKEEIQRLDEYQEEYDVAKNKMSTTEERLWVTVLTALSEHMSKPSYDTWFSKSLGYRDENHRWVVYLPNQFSCDWVERKYSDLILAIMKEYEIKCENISFDVYGD
ncbi:DnaA N-terminal domain-containing protein [Anaerobacillus sp. 1_MG-2023]|uniref:DnaA N-terminal domain-containing protein n=1 Tax=Anaerobacillus sp. 1_MG-2023 TaxID=3062655 RepID=UPI0026E2A2F0|nr:DnaA N-terminal domain-containing protein [Anaerobacillus sp. 1_MG-2023]MDO6657460.1 DnaA N-terminal domain-containing protein [Anaerobacillus sp. 1_MG-2023]